MAGRALKSDRAETAAPRKAAPRARRRPRPRAPLTAVRAGLAYEFLTELADALDIPARELAAVAGIAERTLARRKTEGAFSPEESDRLARVLRIADLAEDILGDAAKATHWLQRSNRALGNQAPLRWLDTDMGTRQVEDVLGRIAHGVTD